jgi:hypothetical protein
MPARNRETKSKSSGVLIVAVIGLIGSLGAAFIANYDKIFGKASGGASSEYPSNMGPLELQTNRNGSDFSPNPERTAGPEACAQLCSVAAACRAMTYVSSPNNLPGGSCWLKTSQPATSTRLDMTSALKLRD